MLNRLWVVLFVSAFWHGVLPGYYLCFMFVPVVVVAETRMEQVVQPSSSKKLRKLFDWINWFILYRLFEYLGCGFMLLEIELVLKTWSQLYYCMHIVLFSILLLSYLLPRRKVSQDGGKCTKAEVESLKKDT